MLAYVFWHRPDAGTTAEEYERALVEFHRALAGSPPPGFRGSACHRFERLPWLGAGGPGYEDWYLADDWNAVGALERGAVSGERREPHDRAAFASAEGAGAVYGVAAGAPGAPEAGSRTWFQKPAGTSYRDLDRLLAPALTDGGVLWRRRLVLGPAPENCLVGAAAGELAEWLAAHEAVGATVFNE